MNKITPLTNQQMFDNALNGIRAQGYQRSYYQGYGACVYYGGTAENGAKLCCAVGHSIPCVDDLGETSNTGSIAELARRDDLAELLSIDQEVFSNPGSMRDQFLYQLQRVHDTMGHLSVDKLGTIYEDNASNSTIGNSAEFEVAMQKLAAKWELVYTPI